MIILIRDNIERHVDSEEKAMELQRKGFKRIVAEEAPTIDADVDFSAMTKAQLLDYAKEHGIEVNPRAKKADILAAL